MYRKPSIVFSLLLLAGTAFSQKVDTAAVFKEVGQLFSEKKFEEGVNKLGTVIEAYPNLKEALYARGAAYLKLQRYDKAQSDIFKALPQYPDAEKRFAQVGWAILQSAKDEEASYASVYFEEAIRRNANSCEGHLGKGISLYQQKRYTECYPSLETSLNICGDNAREAGIYLCNALYLDGKKSEAYQTLDRLLAKYPQFTDGLMLRMDWHKKENELEKALADANQLVAWQPKVGKWYSQRALVHAQMKNREAACSDVLKAEELGDYNGVVQLGAQCKQTAGTIALKAGSVLVYQYEFYGDVSRITVKLTEYSPRRVAFSWEMDGPAPGKGSVAMDAAALDSAQVLLTPQTLANGQQTANPREAAFFLNKKAFRSVKNFGDCALDCGLLPETYGSISPSSHTVRMSGFYQEVPAFSISTKRFDQNIYVLDDALVPLVLKMEMGWTLSLVEVQP
jgi:tetratricopeptide (TPR) repeat protein